MPFPVEGIRDITLQDIQYADELGYSVKLVGVIEQKEGVFNVAVHPSLVPKVSLFATFIGVLLIFPDNSSKPPTSL